MAESFSVKAILSATDKGFKSAMAQAEKSAGSLEKSTESLGSRIKSGLGFGVLMGIGQRAFDVVSNSATGLLQETIHTSDAMQKLQQAMRFSGTPEKEIQRIAGATGTLKKYADETVFSLDDVISTFGALSANGIKDADRMTEAVGNAVAVFGGGAEEFSRVGLAFSQAMAAGALHAEDWNQILDASPQLAGGLKKELIKLNPVLGKDFKGAMEDGAITAELLGKAMNNIGMTEMAKDAARSVTTFEGAMGNMEATAQSGMMKIYDAFVKAKVVSAINVLSKKMGQAFDWVADMIPKIAPYFDVLGSAASEVGNAFGDAFSAIGSKVAELNGKFGSTQNIENFGNAIDVASGALKGFAGFLEDHADIIATLIDHLPQLLAAYLAFKAVKKAATGVMTFGKAFSSLTGKSFGGLAGKLFNTSKGIEDVGKSGVKVTGNITSSAKAFMMLGAGVALVSTGFYLLAQAAVTLSESGGLAIGIFAGMAVAVTALSLGLMAMLTNIQSTPKQMDALGNSFLKVSAGVAVMVTSLAALALAFTPIASLGATAVPPLLAFGVVVGGLAAVFATFGQALKTNMAGIAAFAASVSLLAVAMAPIASTGNEGAVAMAAFGVVVAGLVAVFATFGSALNVAIPGMLALGAAAVLVGEGLNLASGFVKAAIPLVKQLGETFTKLSDGVAKVVDAISGGFAKVLDSIAGIIESIGTSAKNAGIGFESVASGIKKISGLSIGSIVKSLGAVGTGLSTISTKGKDLPTVAAGMTVLVTALTAATANITMFNAGMQTLSVMMTTLPANINTLKASFANFTITPPNVEPLVAAFTRVKTSSQGLVTAFAGLGVAAMMASAQVGASSGGILMLSAVMATAAAGASAMSSRLKSARSGLTAISSGANKAKSSLTSLQASFRATNTGLGTIGPKATSAMNQLTTAFKNAANKAKSAGKQIGTDFTKTMQAGLKKAPSVASKQVNSVISKLRAGRGKAYSAGAYISKGFAQGMLSCMGTIESAARRMAAAADKAVRAKAKIHSPSKVSEKSGGYWGQGWVNGILSKVRAAKAAAQELVSIPALSIPKVSFAYAGEMSADYDYYHNRVYVIEVPVEIEGKEVARASAKYTKEELDKLQARDDRKHGRV